VQVIISTTVYHRTETMTDCSKEKQTDVYADSDDVRHVIFLSGTNQLQWVIDGIS